MMKIFNRIQKGYNLISQTLNQTFVYRKSIVGQTLHESLMHRKFTLPPELKNSHKIGQALNCIEQRWPNLPTSKTDSESPVFIFSAGWRSGSTLMQRLLMSSGEIAIWGEPLDDCAIIPRLAISIAAITSKWPDQTYFDDDSNLLNLSNKWIANLTPPISYLRLSHRALLQTWLGDSAKARYGVQRWGLKEVRLTIDHARYLKWLFPNARFIFIYRNPFHAYRSWKGNLWGSTWPGYFSWSPVAFARHWRFLLEGFLTGYNAVSGIVVKFEDLISNKLDLDALASHIGVKKLNPSILEKKIDSYEQRTKAQQKKLTSLDRCILTIIGGPLLAKLGYR